MMDVIETLSVELDMSPEQLLSDYLFVNTKLVHECGEETTLTKLQSHYPMLEEALS